MRVTVSESESERNNKPDLEGASWEDSRMFSLHFRRLPTNLIMASLVEIVPGGWGVPSIHPLGNAVLVRPVFTASSRLGFWKCTHRQLPHACIRQVLQLTLLSVLAMASGVHSI